MWEQCVRWLTDLRLKRRETELLPVNEKIRIVYDGVIKKLDSQKFVCGDGKSQKKSVEFRNFGNLQFSRKNDKDALRYYTMSVAHSSRDSDELALAYGNRSAALLKLGNPKAALVDVNRALKIKKTPEDKWLQKILDRKQKCIADIQLKNKGKDEKLDEDISELDYEARFPFPETDFKNELIPDASEKIKIAVNNEFGRHLVAVQDIEIGEIIALGKPYAMAVRKEMRHSHCWHCLVRCVSLIPCDNCTLVMFCSEKCRETAANLYHRIECQILPGLFPIFYKNDILALRIFLTATKQGKELRSLQLHPIYGNPFQEKYSDFQEKFMSDDYFTIHNLTDCLSLRKDIAEVMSECMKAAFLIRLLKENSIFEKFSDYELKSTELTDYELFAGTLFLKCKFVAEIHGHIVTEMIKSESIPMSENDVGAGLYPLISLANHSCETNVLRIQHRDWVILRAVLPIYAGEQIFDEYGCSFDLAPRRARRAKLLDDYFFECNCEACKFNWPMLTDMPFTPVPKYLSAKCKIMAPTIKKYSKKFEIFSKTWDTKDENDWKFLRNYSSLLHKNIKKPWLEYFFVQILVRNAIGQRVTYYFSDEDML